MKKDNIFQKIKKYLYEKKKKNFIKDLALIKRKDFKFSNVPSDFHQDLDFLKFLLKKYDNIFLNDYKVTKKNEDVFFQLLEYIKKERILTNINIPEGDKFEKFKVIQKIHNMEKVLYEHLTKEMRNDSFIYGYCLKRDGDLISELNPRFLENPDDVENIIFGCSFMYKELKQEFRENKKITITALIKDPELFQYVPYKLKNDHEFLVNIVKYAPRVVKEFDQNLKNNKRFIKDMMNLNYEIIPYIDYSEITDDLWKKIILKNSGLFEYATDTIKDNRECALKVVTERINGYSHISKRLKDDKEIALLAVKKRGDNLEFVTDRLKDDEEVALAAIENSIWSYNFVSERLKGDKEFTFKSAALDKENTAYVFMQMKDVLFEDIEIVMSVLGKTADLIYKIPFDMLLKEEVKRKVLQIAPEKIVNYIEWELAKTGNETVADSFINISVAENPEVIKYLPNTYKDKYFYMEHQYEIEKHKCVLDNDYQILSKYLRENSLNEILVRNENKLPKKEQKVVRRKL